MKSHRSRPHRIGVFLMVAFVLYSVVGFVLAPPLLKSQLEKRLPVELGRSVRIESIRVNPWILSVAVEGIAITDRDGTPFVAWDRLYVNFDPTSFFVKEWRFQEVTIVAPSAQVTVNKDGSLNFSDLLAKFGRKPEEAGWPLRVMKLVVNRARVEFADHSRAAEFATHLGPVNLALVRFQTAPNRDAPYEFTAETESGEKLRWSGTVSVNPLASEGELHVEGIRPAKYAPYYQDRTRFDVLEGAVAVSGHYKVGLSESGNVATLSRGRVHLTGLKLAPRGSTVPAVELNEVEFAGVDVDAVAMTAKMAKVALLGGRASVHRDEEGTIDLLTMLSPVDDARGAARLRPASEGGRPKLQLEIAALTVRQFGAAFEDLSTPRLALNTIENMDIDLEKITLAEGASMPLRVALTLPRGAAASLSGSLVLSPLQANLAVDVSSVPLSSISPYVEPFVDIRIMQGALSTKGEARVARRENASLELEYKGDLAVSQFAATDGAAHDKFVGWSQLALNGIDLKALPVAVTIKEVAWADLSAHVQVNRDRSVNLLTALERALESYAAKQQATIPTTNTPTATASGTKMSVGVVNITNGAVTFADRSVQPEVATSINQIGGTITGLSSDNQAPAALDLKATVAGSGPLTITGKVKPLGENKSVDLKLKMNDVELTTFSPYSGRFAGYELARGKLFLDVNAKMENGVIDMTNDVTLYQFTFGAPTQHPEATKLPVRLAVALLKDSEGKIELDVPVQGNVSDPGFRIGKVVASTIVNLLTKVAIAPFSLLGSMFGGGGEELAFLDFLPGEAEPRPEDMKKLEKLTKAMSARPALNLEIAGSFDSAADGLVLRQRRFASMLRSRLWDERRAVDPTVPPPDQLVVTPEDEQVIVQKMFAEKFPDLMPEPPQEPPPAAPVEPKPEPKPVAVEPEKKKGFFSRAADIVTLKGLRESDSEQKEREEREERARQAAAAPPPAPAQPEPPPVAVGPPLDEMKVRLMDTVPVTTDDLRRLAARRAERVREYFVQQNIAGERLFLANVGEEGQGTRVFLQLR